MVLFISCSQQWWLLEAVSVEDHWLTALFLPVAQILILLLFLFLGEQMSMTGAGGSKLAGSLQTCAQLQPPHVTHHRRGVKGLLLGRRERKSARNTGNTQQHAALTVPMLPLPVDALTFHLLLAKFFLIWALTDSWMFLSRAVSPEIL